MGTLSADELKSATARTVFLVLENRISVSLVVQSSLTAPKTGEHSITNYRTIDMRSWKRRFLSFGGRAITAPRNTAAGIESVDSVFFHPVLHAIVVNPAENVKAIPLVGLLFIKLHYDFQSSFWKAPEFCYFPENGALTYSKPAFLGR